MTFTTQGMVFGLHPEQGTQFCTRLSRVSSGSELGWDERHELPKGTWVITGRHGRSGLSRDNNTDTRCWTTKLEEQRKWQCVRM